MTEPKAKDKQAVQTRTPQKKTKAGIFDNLRQLPHPVDEWTGVPPQAELTLPSPPSKASPPSPPTSSTSPVAPMRDFQKVPNSLSREAVPAGLFSGKGKQLYDYLYSLTRGAIVPVRSVRVTREELMRGSHIGAKVTLEQNIARLKRAGLISVRVIGGLQGGNEYTVHLPEEVATLATLPSHPSHPSPASNGENLAPLAALETSPPSQGVSPDLQTTSGDPKTFSLRQDRSDDEPAAAFRVLGSKFQAASTELTGKSPSTADAERWGELADVLIAELKIAAARTTVSSVPAFLAEHLRRRLWKIDKRQAQAEGRELPDQAVSAPSESPQNCPDCKGSGWWYPQGQEKGVAKCRHERLASS